MLSGLTCVGQASFFQGVLLDAYPFLDDLITAEVDVGRREIAGALVVPLIVIRRARRPRSAAPGLPAGSSFPAGSGSSWNNVKNLSHFWD
jgi:hypothetical protein